MQKLKLCPFCGGTPIITKSNQHIINIDKKDNLHSIETEFGFLVMCENCCNQTMLWDKKEQAIKYWNNRK